MSIHLVETLKYFDKNCQFFIVLKKFKLHQSPVTLYRASTVPSLHWCIKLAPKGFDGADHFLFDRKTFTRLEIHI